MSLAFAAMPFVLGALGAAAAEPCAGMAFRGHMVALSDSERRLVCGDPKSEAWKDIPHRQVEGFLRAFLQQRGYHSPEFSLRGGALTVDPGRKTLVARLSAQGFPPGVDLSKRRRVVGRPLTPALLDGVKASLAADLQNRGFACPRIAMSADARTGEVLAVYEGGEFFIVREISEPALDGIDPAIFTRFEAFERGRPIDQRLLALTSDRIVGEALFMNSSYEVQCATAPVRLVHRATSAPPRLVRIGVGVDTEGLARLRASWKHSRLGWRASSLQATLDASSREQSLDAFLRWYLGPGSRWHLIPRMAGSRIDDPRYETLSSVLSLMPAVSFDTQILHGELQAGPALEYADTRRGVGPVGSVFLTFNTRFEFDSHPFEYFQRDPRRGSRVDLETSSRVSKVSSELTAHRLRLSLQKLWNLGSYDPPLAVLGSRGWVGTTIIGDGAAAASGLPPAFRFFMGGDGDYRGVGRGELGDELGFLTGAYHGLELRSGDFLPYRIEPLVFLDAAMAGRGALHFDPDVYYAPGLGTRWATSFGSFRVTLARAMMWHRAAETLPLKAHWQFFFSYGREF